MSKPVTKFAITKLSIFPLVPALNFAPWDSAPSLLPTTVIFFNVGLDIGVASGLEYKDYLYGNKWDWLDWIATLIGGLVGQVLQLLFIYLIL